MKSMRPDTSDDRYVDRRGQVLSQRRDPTPEKVFIVVWETDDGPNAQAYATREAAVRDFPEFDERDVPTYEKSIIETTVQQVSPQ